MPENLKEADNLSVGLEVNLVATDDHGDLVGILDSQNLISEGCNFVETCSRNYTIHDEKSLPGSHVLHTKEEYVGSIQGVAGQGHSTPGHA